MTFREHVARILEARRPRQETPPGYRRAAVLLPLYETPAGPYLVLTKRTDQVPTHKGQISFPGGGFHETDGDLLTTALRESAEEIGLRPQDVAVAGVLDDAATAASAHVVRPFVGFIPHPYPFRLDTFEIEERDPPAARTPAGGEPVSGGDLGSGRSSSLGLLLRPCGPDDLGADGQDPEAIRGGGRAAASTGRTTGVASARPVEPGRQGSTPSG